MDQHEVAELIGSAEDGLARVEALAEPAAREAAVGLLRAVLELYGEGLARITAIATTAGGDAARERLAGDELVAHLLLLHGLHPVDLATRVEGALAAVRPRLGGAEPELLAVDDQVVRVRVPLGGGCRSSSATARAALEEAVRAAAPEIERVEIEEPAAAPVVIPLESVRSGA